jgi:CDP-diacylglycerol--serine O-phosphatidyltransferase
MNDRSAAPDPIQHLRRAHRRRRMRRHGRRAYIRSVYFLPSMATLGNAICGFAACYVAAFDQNNVGEDPLARWLLANKFLAAAYLILLAMVFDALDGRLARFTRHTTDFGGQLDSLADVVSFGFAPAFVALLVFKADGPELSFRITRLIWAIAALYFGCAAIRLARFNVSNEHGEQHHFSFLGLPSPGAAGAVVGLVLMQQDLLAERIAPLANVSVILLPVVVLGTGLLMVSNIRYPHLVNRYLRGRRSIARLVMVLVLALLLVVAHRYVIGIGTLAYAAVGPVSVAWRRWRPRPAAPAETAAPLPQPPTSP